jgi:uncharacterized phage-associated protein
MFDSHQREKLVNAINYFVRETRHCHTLKLFKLLNFLDFEHFRETGMSVTGLTYKAWPQGPVPSELWHELRQGAAPDLQKSVSIVPVTDDLTNALMRRDLKPVAAFDESYFSKREMKIMKMLAEIFLDTEGRDMSSLSHMRNLPWHKVYQRGAGNGREIPYELSRSSAAVLGLIETLPDADYEYRKSAFRP